MEPILELASARLLMRQWRDDDLPEFAAMCADPQVMRYFPAPLSRLESAELIGRVRGHFAEHGFGLWALERKDTGQFIGFTGLGVVGFEEPFTPAIEIGWRLAAEHRGLGYAPDTAAPPPELGGARGRGPKRPLAGPPPGRRRAARGPCRPGSRRPRRSA